MSFYDTVPQFSQNPLNFLGWDVSVCILIAKPMIKYFATINVSDIGGSVSMGYSVMD